MSPLAESSLLWSIYFLILARVSLAVRVAPRDAFLGDENPAIWQVFKLMHNFDNYCIRSRLGLPLNGTSQQEFYLRTSFNSPYLSLPSVSCQDTSNGDQPCLWEGYVGFKQTASSSFRSINPVETTQLRLGFEQSADVDLAKESVWISATQSDRNFNSTNQTIGLASKADGLYRQVPSNGILGFGTTAVFEDSIVGHYIASRSLYSLTVGFDLRRQETTGEAGEISWGGVDGSKAIAESFVWLERAKTSVFGEWTTELDGLVITGRNVSLPSDNRTAVFEPAYDLIYLPSSVLDQTFGPDGPGYSKTEEGSYIVPCDENEHPSVAFRLGGELFHVDPRDITSQINDTTCTSLLFELGQTDPAYDSLYVLGSPFLRSVYTALVYPGQVDSDVARPVIGLSQKMSVVKGSESQPGEESESDAATSTSPRVKNVGAIAGGTVGGVAFLASGGIFAFWFVRRRRRAKAYRRDDDVSVSFSDPMPVMLESPRLAESPNPITFTPPPHYAVVSDGDQTTGQPWLESDYLVSNENPPQLHLSMDEYGRPFSQFQY